MTRASLCLLLVFGLVAGACSSGADTVEQETDPGLIPGEEAVWAFTDCLRDEGLDVKDPAIDTEGNLVAPSLHAVGAESLDMSAVHAGFDACRGLLDNVAFGLSSEDLIEREDELLAFAVCMRENGYDMPDPDFSDGHGGAGPFGDAIDTSDPDFETAAQSCDGIVGG
jgi:hypothetical protein